MKDQTPIPSEVSQPARARTMSARLAESPRRPSPISVPVSYATNHATISGVLHSKSICLTQSFNEISKLKIDM